MLIVLNAADPNIFKFENKELKSVRDDLSNNTEIDYELDPDK